MLKKHPLIFKLLLFCAAIVLIGCLLFTFATKHQVLMTLYVLGAFSFAFFCGYLLGGLKQDTIVWQLIYDLKTQIHNKEIAEQKVNDTQARLASQNACLTRLDMLSVGSRVNFKDFFNQLVREAAETINVSRVSLWTFHGEKGELVCETIYDLSAKTYAEGPVWLAHEKPIYFGAIRNARVLAVNDTYHHNTTQELIPHYLPDSNVHAKLDASLWVGDGLGDGDAFVGVLSFEQIGEPREWTEDEQSFSGALADLACLTLEGFKLKQAEGDLRHHQLHMDTIVKTITASIESNAKLFHFMVERAPVSIIYMNSANEIMEMNPEAERLTGYKREYAIGRSYNELFATEASKPLLDKVANDVANGRKVYGQEIPLRCADGGIVTLAVSRSMELNDDGNPVIISIGHDMTVQKELKESLVRAREAAESADRIKSMFVASMSHELRTPLNSIIGFLGVVLQGMSGELNQKQKDQLGRAYQSSKHLLSLITDVIDVSKIEAGYLQTHIETVQIAPLLEEVAQATQHLAEEKHLGLIIHCTPALTIETDRKRLYQVLLNLVSNGLKYTENGSVDVKVKKDKKQITIIVADTGIGIDEAGLAQLFKPFERVESRLKIKTLGTGLGLYLTQSILTKLLGGHIEVSSRPEVGSTFTVTLPLVVQETKVTESSSIL